NDFIDNIFRACLGEAASRELLLTNATVRRAAESVSTASNYWELIHRGRELEYAVRSECRSRQFQIEQARPPLNASFLIELFLPPAEAEALVGDMEERYRLIHKKYGHRRAW